MKNNLRKILSGLALVAMTTGCGLTKHSSPAANSSSETPSSSVNDSSSTGPVDTYEVSEDEWKAAMDLTNYTNVTVDLEMGMTASDPLSDFMSESAAGAATLKASDGKAFVSQTTNNTLEFDKATMAEWTLEALQQAYPDYNLTAEDITPEMVKEYVGLLCSSALKLDVTAEDITETENAYCVVYRSSSMEAYVAKATDDLVDFYEYYDEAELFVKQRTFGDFVEITAEFLDSGCFFADKYSAAEFDEDTNKYYLGTDVLARDFGLGTNDTVDIYYSFLNGKLTSVDFVMSYAEEGMNITETYSYTFKDYGATSVTLPAAESVYACEHENTYESSNDEYHYTRCDDCYSVIEYAPHTMGDHDCTECGYYPSSEEEVTVAGFNLSLTKNDYNNTITSVTFVDMYDTVYNDYDFEGEENQTKFVSSTTTNYVIETTVSEDVAGTDCLVKDTVTYRFYDESHEEIADSIVAVSYRYNHDFDCSKSKDANCVVTDVYTCKECGFSYSDVYESHNPGDPVKTEIDACHTSCTSTCLDCGKEVDSYVEAHHTGARLTLLTQSSNGTGGYTGTATFSCSECGDSYNGSYSTHNAGEYCGVYFMSDDYTYFDELYFAHQYEDGTCLICGAEEDLGCTEGHTSLFIFPVEFNEDGTAIGIYGCEDCGYEEEVTIEFEDLGNGKHRCTVTNESGEILASEEEDHYEGKTLIYIGLTECPCGGSGSSEGGHEHDYYLTDVEMINAEEGIGILHCDGCETEEEYEFVVMNLYNGTHMYMGETETGEIVDFSAEHDFSTGTCHCGATA